MRKTTTDVLRLTYIRPDVKVAAMDTDSETMVDFFSGGTGDGTTPPIIIDEEGDDSDDPIRANSFDAWDYEI